MQTPPQMQALDPFGAVTIETLETGVMETHTFRTGTMMVGIRTLGVITTGKTLRKTMLATTTLKVGGKVSLILPLGFHGEKPLLKLMITLGNVYIKRLNS